ncbi:MAG: single-stranded-DNA-specific exonuclease RecJ [Clostridiales bacterium]|nr:single-stranded-DNA-specific exonuclease RecJ [Clostridiales bacterium]
MQEFIKRAQTCSLPGYEDFLSGLLYARGVRTSQEAKDFLHPSLDALHDPFLLEGMQEAVGLIRALGHRQARAVIYGDYDVDGIASSIIARETLKAAGLKCIIYIPDRHQEGYGLNIDAIRKLSSQAELLLTVDCGISSVEEIALAKKLGMRVIVTDHHQPPDVLPQADAVINPMLGEYPFPSLCGAGTAWKLSYALHGLDFAIKQLDLAALATIADLVPLIDENRVIASFGLKSIADSNRPGLNALIKVSGLAQGKPISSDRVAFALAPRLNAGGRLGTARDAVDLLQTSNPLEAEELAQLLNELNMLRQKEERSLIDSCHQMLENVSLLHRHSILLCAEGWNKGLVGLAAGRLAETFSLPCLVLSQEGELVTGSGRTAGGIDLYAALDSCRDLFLRFGGHGAAVGLTAAVKDIPELRRRFEQAVIKQLEGRPLSAQIKYDSTLNLSDVTIDNIKKLELLEPFGMGNPSPSFLFEGVEVLNARRVGADLKHLKVSFKQGSQIKEGIGFGFGEQFASLPPNLRAVVKLSINEFQNRITPQFQLQAYQAAKTAFLRDMKLERQTMMQDVDGILSNREPIPVRLTQTLAVKGAYGSILFCRCESTANEMHRLYPNFKTAVGSHTDRRGANVILCNTPLHAIHAPCESFYFCDGVFNSREAAYVQALLPQAILYAAEQSQALVSLISSLRHSVDELREIYIKLRGGQCIIEVSPDLERGMAAAKILEEIGLIELHGSSIKMLPVKQADPRDSLIFKLLK